MFNDTLLREIRDRFHHVDSCPYQGSRIFFENAGGALTLKSVAETSAKMAAIPDNQGRDNPASKYLVDVINTCKRDVSDFFGVSGGHVFVGESGTELLFRLIRTAVMGVEAGGRVIGSTLEHPATVSACRHWTERRGTDFVQVPHNDDTGTVTAEDYRQVVTADTRVATIIHTSPVTGMDVDLAAVAAVIRSVSPDCFIIVDGIQHAAHGGIALDNCAIDGYVISAYKVFSRHGYGIAWTSDRLTDIPHENLINGPEGQWELGTRDTGSYATFSDVVDYFDWLGSQFTNSTDRRERLNAAGTAILAHEHDLVDVMLKGVENQRGLAAMPAVTVLGGLDNPQRRGLVSLIVKGMDSVDVVSHLSSHGVRVHVRKADHYSGNILTPLGLDSCVRVSMCHYNTRSEVVAFLAAMEKLESV